MSRCFPYPPPGYEPRVRSEHKDLLKKERHKGKKHREKNGTMKGDRKGNDRGKEDRKRKDRDHKKLKRRMRRERRKRKDRDKDNKTSEQETHKTDDFDNRRLEAREHELVKDIQHSDQLVAFPGRCQPNNKANSTSELLPLSSKGFGAMASKKRERSLSRMIKQYGQAAQNYHGMVQKNGSIAYTNKKGTDASVGSKTRIKNGETLQVGSGEKQSNRKHSSKLKHMERTVQVNEQNKKRNELDELKFSCDDIKKRKESGANNSLHENGARTTKLPRMSPMNISVNGKASPNTQEVEPQYGYSNGTTDSCYLEQHKASVSLSVYDGNEDYLKPPHPDTKYLSQVQSIPQMENISECIDQDWLFSEDRVEQKTTFEAAESHQVWSNAQLIDNADVVALPYVVPL